MNKIEFSHVSVPSQETVTENSNGITNSSVYKVNKTVVSVAKYVDYIIEKHGSCNSTWTTMSNKTGCSEYEAAQAIDTLVAVGKYKVILQDVFGTGKKLHVIYKA